MAGPSCCTRRGSRARPRPRAHVAEPAGGQPWRVNAVGNEPVAIAVPERAAEGALQPADVTSAPRCSVGRGRTRARCCGGCGQRPNRRRGRSRARRTPGTRSSRRRARGRCRRRPRGRARGKARLGLGIREFSGRGRAPRGWLAARCAEVVLAEASWVAMRRGSSDGPTGAPVALVTREQLWPTRRPGTSWGGAVGGETRREGRATPNSARPVRGPRRRGWRRSWGSRAARPRRSARVGGPSSRTCTRSGSPA